MRKVERGSRGGPETLWSRLRARVVEGLWAPVLLKVAGYGLAFVALATVGAGGLSRWLPDAPIPGAQAQTLAASASAPPALTEVAVTAVDAGPRLDRDGGAGITSDGKVVLNVATEDELRRLPGIGPSKALFIVALRVRLGRFRRVEELLRVKGIGRRSLARLRPLLVVDEVIEKSP